MARACVSNGFGFIGCRTRAVSKIRTWNAHGPWRYVLSSPIGRETTVFVLNTFSRVARNSLGGGGREVECDNTWVSGHFTSPVDYTCSSTRPCNRGSDSVAFDNCYEIRIVRLIRFTYRTISFIEIAYSNINVCIVFSEDIIYYVNTYWIDYIRFTPCFFIVLVFRMK